MRRGEADVIVVGAGPAGCAAAIALARAGRRVLLADRCAERPALRIGETLPAVAGAVLRDLGAPDPESAGVAIASPGTTAAWGKDAPLTNDAIGDPYGHGWHLNRAAFDAWLRDRAHAAGAEAFEGRMTVEGAMAARCAWVIDATGRTAAIARGLGARRERHDRLVALYAELSTSVAEADARTRLEATPSGWWYSALIGSGRRVVALLTDSDLVDPRWRGRAGFQEALRGTRHLLPCREFGLTTAPATTAAHGACLVPAVGPGWLAVGDAALAFDPLSSQGILNALVTGVEGAMAVDAALNGHHDAVGAYARRLARVWGRYQLNLEVAYALERRWPGSAFWHRRGGEPMVNYTSVLDSVSGNA